MAMAAAPAVRIWLRLEGAASATSVVVANDEDANVDDLRYKIKEKLANKLKHVDADDLRLSTADGTPYEDPEAPVPSVHNKAALALVVKGTFVRAARSPFAAAHGSSQFLWPHLKPLRPELVGSAKRTELLAVCSRVRVVFVRTELLACSSCLCVGVASAGSICVCMFVSLWSLF